MGWINQLFETKVTVLTFTFFQTKITIKQKITGKKIIPWKPNKKIPSLFQSIVLISPQFPSLSQENHIEFHDEATEETDPCGYDVGATAASEGQGVFGGGGGDDSAGASPIHRTRSR